MSKSIEWWCGDCGTGYPESVMYCTRALDDYLSLRGGSIESAILNRVNEVIEPLVKSAIARIENRTVVRVRVHWTPARMTMRLCEPESEKC